MNAILYFRNIKKKHFIPLKDVYVISLNLIMIFKYYFDFPNTSLLNVSDDSKSYSKLNNHFDICCEFFCICCVCLGNSILVPRLLCQTFYRTIIYIFKLYVTIYICNVNKSNSLTVSVQTLPTETVQLFAHFFPVSFSRPVPFWLTQSLSCTDPGSADNYVKSFCFLLLNANFANTKCTNTFGPVRSQR